jgi:hypothetical protein
VDVEDGELEESEHDKQLALERITQLKRGH